MTEEKIDFENAKDTNEQSGMQALGPGDLAPNNYIKNPAVGEFIVIDIKKVYKDTNVSAVDSTGRQFSTALSGTDKQGEPYKFTIITKEGKTYSVNVWEVWKKLRPMIENEMKDTTKFNSESNEFVQPVLIKVKHIKDGFKDKEGDNYEVGEATAEDLQELAKTEE